MNLAGSEGGWRGSSGKMRSDTKYGLFLNKGKKNPE
jgi:hypothetical protein